MRMRNIHEVVSELSTTLDNILKRISSEKLSVHMEVLQTEIIDGVKGGKHITYDKLSPELSSLLMIYHIYGKSDSHEKQYIKQAKQEGLEDEFYSIPWNIEAVCLDDYAFFSLKLSYPERVAYSLEDACRHIEFETGIPHSPDDLLGVAEGNKIGISFFVSAGNLYFIRLDKTGDNWRSVRCEPLFGESSLKRVVIPTDNPNQDSYFGFMINPREKRVFPLLEGGALGAFASNPEIETVNIFPWSLNAWNGEKRIKIAIIKWGAVSNSIHAEYTEWQKKHGLPTFDIVNKKDVFGGGYIDQEGNLNYFETWSTLEIKRSDLCIPKISLDHYITSKLTDSYKNQSRIEAPKIEVPEKTKTIELEPDWIQLEENKSSIGIFFVASLEAFWSDKKRVPKNTEELRKWLIIEQEKLTNYECMNGYSVSGDILKAGLAINCEAKSKSQIEQSCSPILNSLQKDE